jgi:hypothetical protein
MSSRVTSQKWISSTADEEVKRDSEGRLILHDVRNLFQPVWNKDSNLISVFGRARQGKSFLMNCLAGEENVFKVSNYKESCTQGIDISNKWMPLADFSRVDGGGRLASSNRIEVGFVDAEGQGDKDVSYDANLICPILLASKCVIFNWKGDLQKDHILSTLGIMTRAAKNVSAENNSSISSSSGKKKFGHLHIVFRDWQAVGSTPADTYSILFNPESSKDAATRNQIREDVKEAFESIQVWLFDAPTESVADLRQVLTIPKTTNRFRQQIREFRLSLVEQLKEPVFFAGHPLTGKGLFMMMKDIIATLNRGEAILPQSTYLSMIREEMLQLFHSFSEEIRKKSDEIIEEIDLKKRHEVSVEFPKDKKKRTVGYYLNEELAKEELKKAIDPIEEEFHRQTREILGIASHSSSSSAHIPAQFQATIRDSRENIAQAREQLLKVFLIHFHSRFSAYIKRVRQQQEKEIEKSFHELSSRSRGVSHSPHEFKSVILPAIFESALLEVQPPVSSTHSKGFYSSSVGTQREIDDTIELLQRFYSSFVKPVCEEYEKRFSEMKERVSQLFTRTSRAMEEKIPVILSQLQRENKRGFSKSLASRALDEEFKRLDEEMKKEILAMNSSGGHSSSSSSSSPFVAENSKNFFEFAARTLSSAMNEQYESLKQKEYLAVFLQSEESLTKELAQLSSQWESELQQYLQQLSLSSSSSSSSEEVREINEEEIFLALDELVVSTWRQSIVRITGWLSDQTPADKLADENYLRGESPVGNKLFQFLSGNIEPFKVELSKNVFKRIEKQKQEILFRKQQERERESDNNTIRMEESDEEDDFDDEDEEEQDEEEEGEEGEEGTGILSRAKKSSKVSLAEQRRKAREFAERVLGISFSKGKKAAAGKKTSSSSSSASKKKGGALNAAPKKSLAKQREDARQYAIKQFGNKILEESDNEEEEQEDDEEENNRRKSSSNKRTLRETLPG